MPPPLEHHLHHPQQDLLGLLPPDQSETSVVVSRDQLSTNHSPPAQLLDSLLLSLLGVGGGEGVGVEHLGHDHQGEGGQRYLRAAVSVRLTLAQ